MSKDYICKVCGQEISEQHLSDPGWDGETCSPACFEELNKLSDDLPWIIVPADEEEDFDWPSEFERVKI